MDSVRTVSDSIPMRLRRWTCSTEERLAVPPLPSPSPERARRIRRYFLRDAKNLVENSRMVNWPPPEAHMGRGSRICLLSVSNLYI